MFTPKKHKFNRNLFERLLCNKHTIEADNWVVFKHNTWFLKEEIYKKWLSLEVALGNIAQDLLLFSGVVLPLDFTWFPMPSRYNYHCRVHSHYPVGTGHICPIDGGMLLCYCDDLTFCKQQPPWAWRLTDKGIHPSFINELRSSQVADFLMSSCIRVFIRHNGDFQPYINRFVSANIPICID